MLYTGTVPVRHHQPREVSMMRFVRAATIRPGKLQPALAFAHDIAAHVETAVGVKINVFTQAGGVVGRICWQSDHDDLGAFQSAMGQLLSDAEYLKQVEGAADLFLEGQTRDSLWLQQ